jgi:hypothetical protein
LWLTETHTIIQAPLHPPIDPCTYINYAAQYTALLIHLWDRKPAQAFAHAPNEIPRYAHLDVTHQLSIHQRGLQASLLLLLEPLGHLGPHARAHKLSVCDFTPWIVLPAALLLLLLLVVLCFTACKERACGSVVDWKALVSAAHVSRSRGGRKDL